MGRFLLDHRERFLRCPTDGEVGNAHTFEDHLEVFLGRLETVALLGILLCLLQTSELAFQCYLGTLKRISMLNIHLESGQGGNTCDLWHQFVSGPSRLWLNPNGNQLQLQKWGIHILVFLTHPYQVSQSELLQSSCRDKGPCCRILHHRLQTHGSSQSWGGLLFSV